MQQAAAAAVQVAHLVVAPAAVVADVAAEIKRFWNQVLKDPENCFPATLTQPVSKIILSD